MAEPKWQRVADVRGFLASQGNRNVGTHSPKTHKRIAWPICSRCGLLYLKNAVTAQAIKSPCVVEE